MGQHLGFTKNSNMLRKYLCANEAKPDECRFRLVAHGPLLEEASDWEMHRERRDTIAAVEKALAEAMNEVGYKVMNTVRCRKTLDESLFDDVRTAFAYEFPRLEAEPE